MIESKDLRTGNKVLYDTGKVKDICTLSGIDIGIIEAKESYAAKHYPIPLTPEILEKCGFKKKEGTRANPNAIYFDIFDEDYRIYTNEEPYTTFHLNAGDWFPKLTEVKYLHNLQNLIHSLTNTELNIQL